MRSRKPNPHIVTYHQTTNDLPDLRVEEVPIPTPSEDEVLVQVKAAAINPSDVKNVQGKMHETTVPRIPGRNFSGVVVGGQGVLSGQSVFGSGGNLGFGRDGSHAEFVVVPANAVIPLPRNLSSEQAAGIGVAYMTAWAALVNAARIQPGETALILAPSVVPPPYALFRDADDDPAWGGPGKQSLFDEIKLIPLDRERLIYLTLGGEIRERFEYWNNENFGVVPGMAGGNAFWLQRMMLHMDLRDGPYVRFFHSGRKQS